jgi:hypothetical protein
LSKITRFSRSIQNKNSDERNFTVNFKDFFSKGGRSDPPDYPPAYAYGLIATRLAYHEQRAIKIKQFDRSIENIRTRGNFVAFPKFPEQEKLPRVLRA